MCGKIRLIAVPAEEAIEIGFRKEPKKQGILRYLVGKQAVTYNEDETVTLSFWRR